MWTSFLLICSSSETSLGRAPGEAVAPSLSLLKQNLLLLMEMLLSATKSNPKHKDMKVEQVPKLNFLRAGARTPRPRQVGAGRQG
jgi:hypothetical protein